MIGNFLDELFDVWWNDQESLIGLLALAGVCFALAVLVLTSPIWVIPYLIYRMYKKTKAYER